MSLGCGESSDSEVKDCMNWRKFFQMDPNITSESSQYVIFDECTRLSDVGLRVCDDSLCVLRIGQALQTNFEGVKERLEIQERRIQENRNIVKCMAGKMETMQTTIEELEKEISDRKEYTDFLEGKLHEAELYIQESLRQESESPHAPAVTTDDGGESVPSSAAQTPGPENKVTVDDLMVQIESLKAQLHDVDLVKQNQDKAITRLEQTLKQKDVALKYRDVMPVSFPTSTVFCAALGGIQDQTLMSKLVRMLYVKLNDVYYSLKRGYFDLSTFFGIFLLYVDLEYHEFKPEALIAAKKKGGCASLTCFRNLSTADVQKKDLEGTSLDTNRNSDAFFECFCMQVLYADYPVSKELRAALNCKRDASV